VLAPRFPDVRLWVYEADLAERMCATRENDLYLPGLRIPVEVRIVTGLGEALEGAEVVLSVAPSHCVRGLYRQMLGWLDAAMLFVTATKGLESGTRLRMSEVIREVAGARFAPRVTVLSGPSFAREVARGDPTALVIASTDAEAATQIQAAFSGPAFRLYTNPDPVGVEVGAALKNVIAMAAGVCRGLGLGSNTVAALITRGLVEIRRLAVAMGGQPATLAGLAGLGDLVLTCTGELSRNRQVGIELGRGRKLSEILSSMRMVAEGVRTTGAAIELARKYQLDLPITWQMYRILEQQHSPREAIRELMERALKGE
jgi:glycerol-3-phosphate dehydrogenase (NAD(P)+)